MKPLRVSRAGVPDGIVAIPVRTPLVRPGDDVTRVVADAVHGIARSGDVIALSETAVAIAQNQAIAAEYVRPSRLASVLARNAGPMATVNQPESLQLVIEQAGVRKVLYATFMQLAGRLVGRRGEFYRIMGEAITAIDGYTGTLPPFERMIVFGPKDPDGVSAAIAERTGAECAIVDANDLGIAKVLGASQHVNRPAVERALLANPHGNADEQTPIVVLKWRGQGEHPLVNTA